jgi:hypothetical protein
MSERLAWCSARSRSDDLREQRRRRRPLLQRANGEVSVGRIRPRRLALGNLGSRPWRPSPYFRFAQGDAAVFDDAGVATAADENQRSRGAGQTAAAARRCTSQRSSWARGHRARPSLREAEQQSAGERPDACCEPRLGPRANGRQSSGLATALHKATAIRRAAGQLLTPKRGSEPRAAAAEKSQELSLEVVALLLDAGASVLARSRTRH